PRQLKHTARHRTPPVADVLPRTPNHHREDGPMADESVGRPRPPGGAPFTGRTDRRRRGDGDGFADGAQRPRAVAAVEQEVEAEDEAPGSDQGLNLKVLKAKKISELAQIAKSFSIEGASNMRKQELIFAILGAQTEQSG